MTVSASKVSRDISVCANRFQASRRRTTVQHQVLWQDNPSFIVAMVRFIEARNGSKRDSVLKRKHYNPILHRTWRPVLKNFHAFPEALQEALFHALYKHTRECTHFVLLLFVLCVDNNTSLPKQTGGWE